MRSDTTAAPTWVGWIREGGSWRAVAQGDSHGDVWSQLIGYVATARHTERLLLPAGQHPNSRRRASR